MRYFNLIAIFHSFRIHAKTVVLRSNFTFTSNKVFHGVVKAAVAVVHFKCRYTISPG